MLSSEVPNVCNDLDYLILFDPTRNSKHVADSNFGLCDNFDSSYSSPDWKGPGWYRLIFMRANYNFVIQKIIRHDIVCSCVLGVFCTYCKPEIVLLYHKNNFRFATCT